METQIFINLPVKVLSRSVNFFTGLGFTLNPEFTNEKAACIKISDTIWVMLLTEEFFQTFTKKQITNAFTHTEVILCLSAESREAVDQMVQKAVAAGGTAPNDKQDHGFMYGWGFQDPDGHLWEVAWMNTAAMAAEATNQAAN